MMYKPALLTFTTTTLALTLLVLPIAILAQEEEATGSQETLAPEISSDVGFIFNIADTAAESGDIIINKNDNLIRANTPYDTRIFGVVQKQPVLIFKPEGSIGGRPIARSGVGEVNVTNYNGNIRAGDYITSSDIPGKGQKATQSGYAIGIALTSLDTTQAQKFTFRDKEYLQGKIQTTLKVEYTEITTARTPTRLFDQVNAALFSAIKNPEKVAKIIQYLASGMVMIVSFGVAFATFSQAVTKGVEAVGRNPLARRAIYLSIILNIIFTVLTTTFGIVASVLIIKL